MTKDDEIIELGYDVIGGLLSYPEQLKLTMSKVGATVRELSIEAHVDDYPKIIGRMARNKSALDYLFKAIGERYGFVLDLKIPDREERDHPPNKGFQNNPNWRRKWFMQLLHRILEVVCDEKPVIKEKLIPPRRMAITRGRTITTDEESCFIITPSYHDIQHFDRELEITLEILGRAIGLAQGRRVSLSFEYVGEGEWRPQAKTQNSETGEHGVDRPLEDGGIQR